jgi:hypothetical protein
MKIDRKKLYELYMKKVSDFCEENDWCSTVTPELVINLVSDTLEENHEVIITSSKKK